MPLGYRPRDVEANPLHRAVRRHRVGLVEDLRRSGRQVPAVVDREFDGFLTCGVLAHGFARVRCGACGHELLVPFSWKRRGICPSCTARRAEDTAAHIARGSPSRGELEQRIADIDSGVTRGLSPAEVMAQVRARFGGS